MRIRRPLVGSRLARVTIGAFASLALLVVAAPANAGQVGMLTKTTTMTIINTDTGSIANTLLDTILDTSTATVLDTSVQTLISTVTATDTGTLANTVLDTFLGTFVDGIGTKTITHTVTTTDTGSLANTLLATEIATITDTLALTALNTFTETITATDTGTFANTSITTLTETILFTAQPGDVSIEISQEGLNLTSPFGNSLRTGAILNDVSVVDTTGITQIQANAGNANVSVGTNSVLDGGSLVGIVDATMNAVAQKELGVLTLVPGFAVQNSTKATTAHIAGLALAAAEASASIVSAGFTQGTTTDTTTDGTNTTTDQTPGEDVQTISTAVDIKHSGINEYSPHDNTTVASAVLNQVSVRDSAGITQVQAQAGSANTAGAHNLILVNSVGANSISLNP